MTPIKCATCDNVIGFGANDSTATGDNFLVLACSTCVPAAPRPDLPRPAPEPPKKPKKPKKEKK